MLSQETLTGRRACLVKRSSQKPLLVFDAYYVWRAELRMKRTSAVAKAVLPLLVVAGFSIQQVMRVRGAFDPGFLA